MKSLIRREPIRLSRRSFIRGSTALITSCLLLPRKSRAWTHGGGGGGGGYVAKAVHFDGIAELSIASLSSVDNHLFSAIGWMKQILTAIPSVGNNDVFTVDPNGNYSPNLGPNTNSTIPGYYNMVSVVNDATNTNSEQSQTIYNSISGEGGFENNVWQCIILSFDTSGVLTGFMPGAGKTYSGDTDVTDPAGWFTQGAAPFVISTNGRSLYFGNDSFGDGFLGDLADWRILPGISLLNGSSPGADIPLATRRMIIDADGKPVNPAVLTAFLGTPGAVLFSGDATGFPVNQGTGGAFAVTAGSLTNASTSPSD